MTSWKRVADFLLFFIVMAAGSIAVCVLIEWVWKP